jgi:hypothetical protein
MKFLIVILFSLFSFNAFSAEAYDCNFGGSHFFLKMSDDNQITLENKFQKFQCEIGYTNFPGTEIEMRTLECEGKFHPVTYIMTQYDDQTIILSKNIVFSKGVTCKKI